MNLRMMEEEEEEDCLNLQEPSFPLKNQSSILQWCNVYYHLKGINILVGEDNTFQFSAQSSSIEKRLLSQR